MMIESLYFFYNLGLEYSFIKWFALFISGPFSYILFPLITYLLILLKTKNKFYNLTVIFLSMVSSLFSAIILKNIYKIDRPFISFNFEPLTKISGYSFPSEHASVYGALVITVFFINKKLGFVSLFIAFLIVTSRVILGVHYPIDVISGFILGGFIALLFYKLIPKDIYDIS
jgi:undecaprenyl-diphosphatase